MGYKISQRAEEQIIEAYIYGFKTFGENQAEQYAASLYDCFDLLSNHPRLANIREGYDHPLRIHHHGKHYLVYTLIESTGDILILSVLREESDLARHLNDL